MGGSVSHTGFGKSEIMAVQQLHTNLIAEFGSEDVGGFISISTLSVFGETFILLK
jgi:hypothetical protein